MPKENTHLYFARLAMHRLSGNPATSAARQAPGAYFWGAVAPDALYYGLRARYDRAAGMIHGDDGSSPAGLAVALMRDARDSGDVRARVFCLGYASHMVLDAVFHPVVNALVLAGTGTLEGRAAVYAHRALETTLDALLNPDCRAGDMLDPGELSGLRPMDVLVRRTGLGQSGIKRAFRFFRTANILFTRPRVHALAALASRLPGLDTRPLQALFYAHRPPGHACFPARLVCRDGGAEEALAPRDLVERALALAESVFAAADGYFRGERSDGDMERALPRGTLCRGLVRDCVPS